MHDTMEDETRQARKHMMLSVLALLRSHFALRQGRSCLVPPGGGVLDKFAKFNGTYCSTLFMYVYDLSV
jgi:hypothetical protein